MPRGAGPGRPGLPQGSCGRQRPWTRRPPSPFQIVKEPGGRLPLRGRLSPVIRGILPDCSEEVNGKCVPYAHCAGRSPPVWERFPFSGEWSAPGEAPIRPRGKRSPHGAGFSPERGSRLPLERGHPYLEGDRPYQGASSSPQGGAFPAFGGTVPPKRGTGRSSARIVRREQFADKLLVGA